jgi:hypothetical protein
MASSIGSPNETTPSPSPRRTGADIGKVKVVVGAVVVDGTVVVDVLDVVVVDSAAVVVVAIDAVGAWVMAVETDRGPVAAVSLVPVDAEAQPSKTTTAIVATRTMLRTFATPTRCLPQPTTGIRHHPYNIGHPRHRRHKWQTTRPDRLRLQMVIAARRRERLHVLA